MYCKVKNTFGVYLVVCLFDCLGHTVDLEASLFNTVA